MRKVAQLACLLAGALVALAPFGASAQMPPDIAAKIKEIGRVHRSCRKTARDLRAACSRKSPMPA